MFIKIVAPEDATGEVAEIYRGEIEAMGFVMEATASWTAVPGLTPMVEHLLNTARRNFSLGLRAWRLITLIAAKHVPSTYCSLVYGKLLAKDLGRDQVFAIHRDFRNAGLAPRDVAMLAYAEQVARDASKTTAADIERLRAMGFDDQQIGEIAFCAAFRCFMSRYFDAVGASPEATFLDSDPVFRAALTVGKPVPA